ncbi:hypothetical protein J422_03159 [Methanocaldococcus villosus KIN24-T80]|uniref:4-vinyl reductase 4VR domain-containing protein n=1 Tax=Methanocaldococcus villosus KIN24-T80 TaxID=1069083 RepID=N6VQZ6_9EURY|nr:V4R domain-containing protein [Methanocaldococcus villosus]ENN96325.1 hypothetical protein J422_03159 [Methanocaldococcus villosus KIN24-T80]
MANATAIVEMLRIIDNRAKFMGIKLTMIKNLLEKYKDNKELLKEVLKETEGTKLHDLILEACPYLRDLDKEIKAEEARIKISAEEEKPLKLEDYGFVGKVSLLAYIREYMRKYYLRANTKKVFYQIGKDYAILLNINNYDEMKKFIDTEFGEMEIEKPEPLTIIVRDNKECKNCTSPEPVCYVTAGFIAGCLENIVNRKYIVDVVEKKCLAVGDPYCLFVANRTVIL